MVQIKIGEQLLDKPEVITIEQFQNLIFFNFEDARHDAQVCAYLLFTDVNKFTNVNVVDLLALKAYLLEPLAALDSAEPKDYIEGYKLIDFNEMSFGTFVDLDVLTVEGLENNLSQIIAMLYNASTESVVSWPIEWVWSALSQWQAYRIMTYKNYEYLFASGSTAADTNEGNKISIRSAWYKLIISLSGEDFLKVHQVVDRPLIEALNFLDWLKAKREQEAREARKKINKLKMKK